MPPDPRNRWFTLILSLAAATWSGIQTQAPAGVARDARQVPFSTDYRLAENGRSRLTVLYRGQGAPLTEAAVGDLTRSLGKVLGVTVRLAREESGVTTPLVIEVAAPQRIEGLGRDGFVLRTEHNRLVIKGSSDNGISDGIYTLLGESFGCRWLQPGDLWEVTPSKPEATLPRLEVFRNPPFRYRILSHNGAESGLWNQRNRATVDVRGIPAYGFGHNLNHVFPPSIFGQSHPEYFALINGVRRIPTSDGEQFANPCFSNPGLATLAAAAASRFFDGNPESDTFSLCINDTSEHCHCESCRSMDGQGGRGQGEVEGISESYFHFVNETAKIVARTHPGKYLGVYAYWSVYAPPQKLDRLPANVVVQLTQDGAQFHDPAYRARNEADWWAWRVKASRIGHYDYYSLGWFTPRFYPQLAAQTIRFLETQGADGFYCEIYPNWCWAAPQCWMMTRLLWNPRQSADALLDEFCRAAYGPAAREMRAFYDTCEQYWLQPRKGIWFDGLSDFNAEMRLANRALMEKAWTHLERAATRAHGVEAKRVAYVRDHFRLPYLMVTSYVAARELATSPLRTAADLAELTRGIQALAARETEAVSVWETVWEPDKTYPSTYYDRPNFTGKWNNQWKPDFSRWLMVAARQAERFCRERGDPIAWENFFSTLPNNVAIDRAAVERHGEVRTRSVTIDADAADWAGIPSYTLYRLEPSGDYQDSPSESQARVRVAHDAQHFSVLVEAEEAELIQHRRDHEIWREDAIQITLHPDVDAIQTPGLDDQTTELGFAFPDGQPFVWRWHGPDRAPGPTKEVLLAVRRSGRHSIYEAAIPWRELGIRRPKSGKRMGFSIALVDAGTNRNAAYFGWGGGVLFGKDLRLLVPMTLK